ncbi:hypothetical protein F2Q68_00006359 [Brassica cretica]|uniref:Replication protein A 70 kDa DNA-binding subunit B/D first OB fold domain-containing protein n=1 Tax=Brassica cretica TaxID=69181 RepID=A0A8S9J848_BRACR|nr:hypothetical protein F2Q68_00006359 [Brassica cretica]
MIAQGNKIHASCKKAYFDRLENKVPVGAWRNIDHFLVTNNGGSYKTTNHQYKIVFIPTTDITPSTLQEENMFFSLVGFESIQSGKLDTTNLIDVIGQVFELGDQETVQCHGKQRKKIEFSLRDISDQCGNRNLHCGFTFKLGNKENPNFPEVPDLCESQRQVTKYMRKS